MDLKEHLIALGNEHPDLRDHLRVILDYVCTTKEVVSEEPVQAPEVQPVVEEVKPKGIFDARPLPVPKSEETFFNLSPDSFRAFNTVILPQIQAKLDAASFQDLHQMMEEMEGLGKARNHELESALIVFKPISMNTRRFYQEVQTVFQNWIRPKLKLHAESSPQEAPKSEDGAASSDEGKNYNIVFK